MSQSKYRLLDWTILLLIATDPETVLAVIPKTQSVTYKTSLNDRLVQYTVDFDYAFDKINTVR